MKLAVVSSLEYYRTPRGYAGAWPAAVREIDALATLFDRVVHVACLHPGEAPAQAAPHAAPNVEFEWMPPAGGPGLGGKLDALRALPARAAAIERAWKGADAVLVRCPSNAAVAALGLMTLGLGPARRWVKYTGAWQGRCGEKPSYKLQRWWTRSGVTGARVSIGGLDAAPGAEAVCNPSLSMDEAREAERRTRGKRPSRPWRLLCVARLVPDKGVDVALRALAQLGSGGFDVRLDVAGDGPERVALRALAHELGLSAQVRFHGWLPARELGRLYAEAHLLLAPTRGEGWSRAWTDAAAHRCVPMVAVAGSAHGLQDRGAGVVLSSLEVSHWAGRIADLLCSEADWRACAERGPALARELTYERFLDRAREMFSLSGPLVAEEWEKVL